MAITDRTTRNVIIYSESGITPLIDSNGLQLAADVEYAINKNLIANGISDHVKGYASTATANITALRATAYTEPASASQMEILSANAADASAGTGARTLRITYYDGSMNGPFTEDKTLNGVTAVPTTATNIRFVEKIEVLTVGSTGSNVGVITLRLISAGATVGTIAATDGITYWGHHYIPSGKVCFIRRFITGSLGNSGISFIRAATPLTANAFEKQISPNFRVVTAQPSQNYEMEHFTVDGPARTTIYVKSDSSTAATFNGGFFFYEVTL